MEPERFDALTRSLRSAASSRRRLLAGASLGALLTALAARRVPATHFDCRHVGVRCKRNDQCCSGRCRGKVGRKTCRAHHEGTCTAAQLFCKTGTAACGAGGTSCNCGRTTGGAMFCAQGGTKIKCTTDRQCEQEISAPGAACVAGCGTLVATCAYPCET
jgi:hypothetical protein